MFGVLKGLWTIFTHTFRKRETILYPEQKPSIPPRWRGRIILSRDPDGGRTLRCLLSVCSCVSRRLHIASGDGDSRRAPLSGIFPYKLFPLHFLRLLRGSVSHVRNTTDAGFEMSEYERHNLVYEKEHLLISGPGKYPGYNFYRVSGLAFGEKRKGEAENETPPVDVHDLMP